MTLLPARGDLALCSMSQHCPAKDRCYRSPSVRAIATGRSQNWMETTPRLDGPCSEWWAASNGGLVFDESCYITADQIEEFINQGWSVEPSTHRSPRGAECWMAKREMPL